MPTYFHEPDRSNERVEQKVSRNRCQGKGRVKILQGIKDEIDRTNNSRTKLKFAPHNFSFGHSELMKIL